MKKCSFIHTLCNKKRVLYKYNHFQHRNYVDVVSGFSHSGHPPNWVKTTDEAVYWIPSYCTAWIHSIAAAPHALLRALVRRHSELRGVRLLQIHTDGEALYTNPEYQDSFKTINFFVGKNTRSAVKAGYGHYVPCLLSELPYFFRQKKYELDYAFIQVSEPDRHGFCSLGTSVDVTLAAVEAAKHVIAQVNPQMPYTHGDGIIHINSLDTCVRVDEPIPTTDPPKETSAVTRAIAKNVAQLVQDKATLQMGIGAIPDAVLTELGERRGLGIHSEMFSDGVLKLVEDGVVTNEHKIVKPHKIISSFVRGSRKLYDFIDHNPMVELHDTAWVNDPSVIQQNKRVTAINGAIEIDLTGQVCADSIGPMIYSGVGGQMDFLRGAALSEDGVPIIAMPSTTRTGESKLKVFLQPGAGVVTTRAHVHWVCTEYGSVNLFGKSIKERSQLLVSIAHPKHRNVLEKGLEEYHRKGGNVSMEGLHRNYLNSNHKNQKEDEKSEI